MTKIRLHMTRDTGTHELIVVNIQTLTKQVWTRTIEEYIEGLMQDAWKNMIRFNFR